MKDAILKYQTLDNPINQDDTLTFEQQIIGWLIMVLLQETGF